MVLSNADMKTNCLCILRCLSVSKLVCKCNIECCGKDRKKFKKSSKNSQKSFGLYKKESSPDVLELKISYQTWQKSKTRKTKISEQVYNLLRLRLFRTGAKKKNTVCGKYRLLFLEYTFLVERRYYSKSLLQKENDFQESYVYLFMENFCGRWLVLEV